MQQFRPFTADDAVQAAAAALARVDGATVIDQVRDIGGEQRRNIVLRASATSGGILRSIIIKATPASSYDPTAETAYENSGLIKEWAATTLLTRRTATPGGGALLAADVPRGVLVFGDHGEALGQLVDPLLRGTAEKAEQALTQYAIALAHLHAGTMFCREEHAQIIRDILPAASIPPPASHWIEREPRKVIALLGFGPPEDELELMARHARSPGPWLALAHRDPCPDNVLLTDDGIAKLIDFEFSTPGHALLDAAYWRMGFPTCWCAGRIPDAVIERLDAAYRAALAGFIPTPGDDAIFEREMAIICAIWMLGSLAWLLEEALKADSDWGIATNRGRILHYLDTAIRMTDRADVLPGTRGSARTWLDTLRDRWQPCAPLALYPAFAGFTEKSPRAVDPSSAAPE